MKPSPDQLDGFVDLCRDARVHPRDVTRRFHQAKPGDLTRSQVSDLCHVLTRAVSAGTFHSLNPLDALVAHAAGRPFDKEHTMTKTIEKPTGDVVEWACEQLGITNPTDEQCPTCGGSGTVTTSERATITALQKAIRNSPNLSVYKRDDFAKWCENPRVETLRHVADLLKADLDAADEFLRVLAGEL